MSDSLKITSENECPLEFSERTGIYVEFPGSVDDMVDDWYDNHQTVINIFDEFAQANNIDKSVENFDLWMHGDYEALPISKELAERLMEEEHDAQDSDLKF